VNRSRRTALLAGALYLLTVVTSIPALALKAPVLADPASLSEPAARTALLVAAVLELVLAAACIGTAVVLLPVLRAESEPAAFAFLAARIVEGALVVVGVIAMVALTRVPPGPADGVLVALHDGAFLLGPGLIPAVNALCLGFVLFRTRLVPRILPLVGFVGAPLLVASAVATLAGATAQVSAIAGAAALPIALWEISLGVWLVVRGFDRGAIDRLA
jgi:hypothetical protein